MVDENVVYYKFSLTKVPNHWIQLLDENREVIHSIYGGWNTKVNNWKEGGEPHEFIPADNAMHFKSASASAKFNIDYNLTLQRPVKARYILIDCHLETKEDTILKVFRGSTKKEKLGQDWKLKVGTKEIPIIGFYY